MRAVNLIPTEQRVHTTGMANRSEGVAYIVLGMFVGVALLVLLYGMAHNQIAGKEGEVKRLEAQAQQVQQEATGLGPYKSFIALRESREQAIVGLINTRFDWAHTLSELGRVLPPGSTVATLHGSVGSTGPAGASNPKAAATVTSATPAGTVPTLTITGCATSQSTVALVLTRLRLMDGVSNVELHSSTKTAAEAASGGGATGGGCPAKDPSYSATVDFQPLPAGPTKVTSEPRGASPSSAAGGSTGKTRQTSNSGVGSTG
ncbi:MAG: hypothetical protein ACYDA6_02645 [Solirubrobacteraceae bacterium]